MRGLQQQPTTRGQHYVVAGATGIAYHCYHRIISKTIDRAIIWMAQTPQTFHRDKLIDAFKNNINVHATDESILMELSGHSIKIIYGDAKNFKITNKLDWELAKIIIGRK